MAELYPERPRAGAPRSEQRVYEALAHSLDGRFVVFHSLAWHGRGEKPDGEADFLIAHPDLGLLVLEVKGGGIAEDPRSGRWESTDRDGVVHAINDPYQQALAAKHQLLAEIRADPRWPAGRRCQAGYAVVFPDIDVPVEGFSARGKPEITFGRGDLDSLGRRVVACLAYWREVEPEPPPRADGVRALVAMFGTARRYRIPLAEILREDDGRIIELTEQQYDVLDQLARHRRAAIAGCAGSGKTLLAIEKARRLADAGYRVLLTCFNRALATHWREDLTLPPRVQANHFHGVCADAVRAAAIKAPDDEDYMSWLPQGLIEAAATLGPRYDGVVVDEGQDFKRGWLEALDVLLANGPKDPFYLFFDDNQRLYALDAVPAWLGEPFQLTRNVRNTTPIGALVNRFYDGPPVRLSGVDGREVQVVAYPDEAPEAVRLGQLRLALERLRNEGAALEDIVVLSPRRSGPAWRRRDFGSVRLYARDAPDGNVFFDTIQNFKGQDAPVVVLTELELAERQDPPELDALLYVGCSRGRTLLVVVTTERLVERMSWPR